MRRGFKVWRCGRDQIGQGVVVEGGGDFGEKVLKERPSGGLGRECYPSQVLSHQMIGEMRVGKVREDGQARPSLLIFEQGEG